MDVRIYIWCVCPLSHTNGWVMDKQLWKPLAKWVGEEVEEVRGQERFYCESWNPPDFKGIMLERKILIQGRNLRKFPRSLGIITVRWFLLFAPRLIVVTSSCPSPVQSLPLALFLPPAIPTCLSSSSNLPLTLGHSPRGQVSLFILSKHTRQ